MRNFYTVHTHAYGRKPVTQGPMQGCYDFASHHWAEISVRPLSLEKAVAQADQQPQHTVVCQRNTSTVVYDNGKEPALPQGWRPA